MAAWPMGLPLTSHALFEVYENAYDSKGPPEKLVEPRKTEKRAFTQHLVVGAGLDSAGNGVSDIDSREAPF